MIATPRYRRGLHVLAVIVAGWTLFMIIAGGMVTSQNAGDSVPDWPLSYGSLLPPMVGNVFWEHGHRLVGMALGLLALALTIWILRVEHRPRVRLLGWLAFPAVCAQGLLGGLRVKLISSETIQNLLFANPAGADIEKLRVGVAIFHTATAQLIFCMMVVIAVVTSRRWLSVARSEWIPGCVDCGYDLRGRDDAPMRCPECGKDQVREAPAVAAGAKRLRALGQVTLAIIFVQLLLGALRRQTDGTIWFHAIGAGLVALHVGLLARRALGGFAHVPAIAQPAVTLVIMLAGQLVLGVIAWLLTNQAIVNSLHLPQIRGSAEAASALLTAHLALGAGLFAWTVVLVARSRHHVVTRATDPAADELTTLSGRLAST
jgi:cytochrome c oxidase assembly protein subunit 15